ncbi:ribonuclease H-like domain-containing protein [Tanacetum coccineum]
MSKIRIKGKFPTEMELVHWNTKQQEHQSDTKVFTVMMEILLEPTSNKLLVDPHGFEGYIKIEVKGNPQQKEYKEKGVIDSGCSRHITGNKCYLTEYKDYDSGFISFGYVKGRISRKVKIKTGTLDFDNVYFCKELKYNLFSVLQICDKKNNVLFTDTECLVLSFDFKLLDESQVLLRVPRKDNIYSVDLKSVVPTKGLTCLFAKATIDESNLWHRCWVLRGNSVLLRLLSRMVLLRGGIEAARTMLVDSKLPTTFWAEAVNTACYVLNRVLVIKPHNKTPYELIRGRTPLIDFMKPFGCPVTILNTMDLLGMDRWLFDVDSLTISMNYVPVVAGNQTNGIAGTRDNIVVGQAEKKKEHEQEYILIPFYTTDPLISQDPKVSEEDAEEKPTEMDESGASDKDGKDEQAQMCTPVSTVGPSCTDDDPSSPVNAAEASNAFEEHLFEQFSPFQKSQFTLPSFQM